MVLWGSCNAVGVVVLEKHPRRRGFFKAVLGTVHVKRTVSAGSGLADPIGKGET